MKLDQQKVLSIYKQLPDVLKSVINSERNQEFNRSLIQKYNIINKDSYMELTTKVMLNLLPFSELRKRLVEESVISEMEADACVRDIKNYIQPLLDYWAAGQKEQGVDQNVIEEPESQRPVETEAPTRTGPEQTVQPLRTMEGDLKRIHGYGSFGDLYGSGETEAGVYKSDQDAVVKKNLAGTPTYNEPKAES